ncbi:MAG: hypothetical protein H7061_02125 [Bdellovibrionaceae bacterium]|nr:hypothetical protein [Bdellovibrio sp.]
MRTLTGLIVILFLAATPLQAQTTCAHLNLADAANELQYYAKAYSEMLCSRVSARERSTCQSLANQITENAFKCLALNLNVKHLRSLVTAFLRDENFVKLVLPAVLGPESNSEESHAKYRIWRTYRMLAVGSLAIKNHRTNVFSVSELKRLEESLALSRQAVLARVGSQRVNEFSHMWGAYGMLTKKGNSSITGQVFELNQENILELNIVINDLNKISAVELGQRLLHEAGHAHDHLLGMYLTGDDVAWTDTADAKIYKLCQAKPAWQTRLWRCYADQPNWFNFNRTNYAGFNAAEFYALQLNEWARENLGLVPTGRYRCQNATTLALWNDMEKNLIGEIISAPCPRTNEHKN